MKKTRLFFALAVLLSLLCSVAFAATTHYSFVTPVVGGSQNTWGTTLNTLFGAIDTNLWAVSGGTSTAVNAPGASGSNITLTNPLSNVQNIAFSATSLKLILPAMNATQSLVPGGSITINNVGSNAFQIVAQDTSTNVVTSVPAGFSVVLTLLSGATANGTFQFTAQTTNSISSILAIANGGTNASTAAAALTNLGGASLANSNTFTAANDFTGATITVPTQAGGDSSTKAASTAFVAALGSVVSGTANQLAYYAGSGTAVSGTNTLPSGTLATTQAVNTSNTTVATTAFANPGCNFGNPGYCKFASGLILQWGYVTGLNLTNGSTYTVTYPIAFSTATFAAVASPNTETPNDGVLALQTRSFSTTGFDMQFWDANSNLNIFSWVAVGQ